MRRFPPSLALGLLIMLLCAATWALASGVDYPTWWTDYGVVPAQPPPGPGQMGYNVTTYNAWVAQNYLPANLGQLKNFAAQAQAYLDNNLASIGGSGPGIGNIVANFSVNSANNFSPVNLGQIKAVTQPVYDRLYAIGFNASTGLAANYGLTGLSGNWNGTFHYPWPVPPPSSGNVGYNVTTYNAWVAQNYQPTNLGQLKTVFSFDLGNFTPAANLSVAGDGIPDWWKVENGLDPFAGNIDDNTDFGDDQTDLQHFQFDFNVFNGSVDEDLSGNMTAFQNDSISASVNAPTDPGDYIPPGDTSLAIPYQSPPQYAVVDLGTDGITDMNDNGQVLLYYYDEDSNLHMQFWSVGTTTNISVTDGDYVYNWLDVADNGTVLGTYYNSTDDTDYGFASWTVDGGVSQTNLGDVASAYIDSDLTGFDVPPFIPIVVTRNAIYTLVDAYTYTTLGTGADDNPYGYENDYWMVLGLHRDGSVTKEGDVMFDGGEESPAPTGNLCISYPLARDSANDTLTMNCQMTYTSQNDTIYYVSSYDEDDEPVYSTVTYTETYPDWDSINATLQLNGNVVSNPGGSGETFWAAQALPPWDAYFDPYAQPPLVANIGGTPTLVNPYYYYEDTPETVDVISDGNLATANLTTGGDTPVQLYGLNCLGLGLTGNFQLWLNGNVLAPENCFPGWAINSDGTLDATAVLPGVEWGANISVGINC
ncbi:MAG TPA: hypothetical protein VK737_01610, partial [Opitutales bacterium]|nr:hypothetical protein [Opitutales bacterium]